jgi:DNA-directed RNA polymerase subunit RPC12/RpoP
MSDPKQANVLNPYIVKRFGRSGVHGIYKNPMHTTCFFCTQKETTYDIGAQSPAYRCCQKCIEARGIDALRNGADEAAQLLSAIRQRYACIRCKQEIEPSLNPRERQFVCEECKALLPRYAQKVRKVLANGGELA